MSKTILVDRLCGETCLALIEDGALAELYFESKGHEKLTGNIYVGRVENVLPGMNAAFVDGHAKMMSYYDIPNNSGAGLGNSTVDPNSFWAQWKN